MLNGGYVMVSKNDTKLYEKLNNALTLGKPVLWYENANTCYYIDTITRSGTNIILTKGGKTITIESDGDITESGNIIANVLEDIIDKDGNKRFIEGELNINNEFIGLNILYNKWSLSGTHLIFVLAGYVESGNDISRNVLGGVTLPEFIRDKIVPVWSQDNSVEIKNVVCRNISGNNPVDLDIRLLKSGYDIYIYNNVAVTSIAEDKYFRIQFDLLIDNE